MIWKRSFMLTNPVAPMMMTLLLLNAGQNVQNAIIKMQLLQWFIEDYFGVFHMKRSHEHKNDHVFSENRFVKTNLIRFGVYLHFFRKKVEFIVDWLSKGYRTKYFQSNWLKCKKKNVVIWNVRFCCYPCPSFININLV